MLAVLPAVVSAIALQKKVTKVIVMKLFPYANGNLFRFISKVNERLYQTQQPATV